MKLSMETYALRQKFGDEKAISLIKKAGFDAIDYSFYWAAEGTPMLGENYRDYAAKNRAHMDREGISCHQTHAPLSLRYGGRFNVSDPKYLEVVRSIEASKILGAKYVIVHAVKIPEEVRDVDFTAYNLEYFKTLEPYCEKFGIQIAVENLFAPDPRRRSFKGVLASPDSLCAFIRELNSPHFVACVDVGHAAITGTEPEDFIRGMDKSLLKTVHIHDTEYLADIHTLPYAGRLDWDAIISALKEVEYDGDLTFEIFGFFRRMPDCLAEGALQLAEKVGRHLLSLA